MLQPTRKEQEGTLKTWVRLVDHQGGGRWHRRGMEWQKENTDASRVGESVPWKVLVKSSRVTQIIKKETVNNVHDHFACITPKGKNRLQLRRDILCEHRISSATYFITFCWWGKKKVQRLPFSFFLPLPTPPPLLSPSLMTTEKIIMIALQKMGRALKAKEMVMTTTAIQALIKRTSEKTERSQERKTSIILLEEN